MAAKFQKPEHPSYPVVEMADETAQGEAPKDPNDSDRGRTWPPWVACTALLVALVVAGWSWIAASQAEERAEQAESDVATARVLVTSTEERATETAASARRTQDAVLVVGTMFQPGIAGYLASVYLMAAAAGCESASEVSALALVDQIPAASIPPQLADHTGWEAALDTGAIQTSLESCSG